jgi:hypothetical protein
MYPFKLASIKRRINSVLAKGERAPSDAVVENAIVFLSKHVTDENGRDSVIRFERERGHVYVTDPFFKVFLMWSLLPRFTGKFPQTRLTVEEVRR